MPVAFNCSVSPCATDGSIATERCPHRARCGHRSVAMLPSVAQGLTLQLKATGIYSDGTNADLTSSSVWASLGGDATVDANTGIVTGVNIDPAVTITADWPTVVSGVTSNVTGTTKVAVTAPVLESLAITPAGATLPSGGTSQLK